MSDICYLFSYGTLQLIEVQIETYGRKLSGDKDILNNYRIEQLEITDNTVLKKSQKRFHPIAIPDNYAENCIEGTVYEITQQELVETDKYEVSDYKRILVTLASGKKAWVYVSKKVNV